MRWSAEARKKAKAVAKLVEAVCLRITVAGRKAMRVDQALSRERLAVPVIGES
jgi:hypothetical protein